jgi:hypothetical protein
MTAAPAMKIAQTQVARASELPASYMSKATTKR